MKFRSLAFHEVRKRAYSVAPISRVSRISTTAGSQSRTPYLPATGGEPSPAAGNGLCGNMGWTPGTVYGRTVR